MSGGFRGARRGRGGHNFRGSHEDQAAEQTFVLNKPQKPPISAAVQDQFLAFQRELDCRHDRYERLVKISRDITIESKRTIFSLHRIVSAASPEQIEEVLSEADKRLAKLRSDHWLRVGRELAGEDPYLYMHAYSPGLQEYIEAATFAAYLRHGTLLSWSDVRASLTNAGGDDSPTVVTVPLMEYLCGVADLTGELMRAAVNFIAAGNQQRPVEICHFLTDLYGVFSLLGNTVTTSWKDWSFKMRVFRNSLTKVENVCYVVKLRGTEVPDYMLADVVATVGGANFSITDAEHAPVDMDF